MVLQLRLEMALLISRVVRRMVASDARYEVGLENGEAEWHLLKPQRPERAGLSGPSSFVAGRHIDRPGWFLGGSR